MATVTINITVVAGVCRVTSPANVSTHDDIKWVNQTSDRVVVAFPHDAVLAHGLRNQFSKTIKPGKSFTVGGPESTIGIGDVYRYAVYCQKTDSFGIGQSDPEIIVT